MNTTRPTHPFPPSAPTGDGSSLTGPTPRVFIDEDDELPPVLGEKYRDALCDLLHAQADNHIEDITHERD